VFDKQYEFQGKHAEMVYALRSDSSGSERPAESLFRRFIDVYLIAPLVGFLYSRKAPVDSESKAEPRSIFAETIIGEKERLTLNYRLIMLLDGRREFDINIRVGKAFREIDDDLVKSNMDLYDSYVRGGVEVLYEKLIGTAKTEEEWIGNMMDFVIDFEERFTTVLAQQPSE
jgi:hypothetical protein